MKSNWPEWYCPFHQKPIKRESNGLVCPDGDRFPLKNGIPRFISNSYAEAFGPEAKEYRVTQLDSYSGITITRDRARRCIGDELWSRLTGKQVLEAGSGAGRFTEILLRQGACVTSVDITEAVDANQDNFPQGETHRIAQADIERLPFAPRQFDLVFCLGVIQNTPNPEITMGCLYEQVKPGGWLVIDHYTYSLSWCTKTAPLFRLYLKRLPPERGLEFTKRLVNRLLPLHKKARRFYPAQTLLSRLSPVVCYYQAFPQLRDELQQEWALLDTHGSLTVWYRHVRTRRQIHRTLEQLGLQKIWCQYGGNGVEARGMRPL